MNAFKKILVPTDFPPAAAEAFRTWPDHHAAANRAECRQWAELTSSSIWCPPIQITITGCQTGLLHFFAAPWEHEQALA
jgi:hypothetical protein